MVWFVEVIHKGRSVETPRTGSTPAGWMLRVVLCMIEVTDISKGFQT